MINQIKYLTEEYFDEIVALRRNFHRYPEVSGREFNTQHIIMEELAKEGLVSRSIAGTGVITEICGIQPGKTVAIRADIDALPIADECNKSYQSQISGVCHACGHDGHIAIALGIAKVLNKLKNNIKGKVQLLFQPCEELGPGGATDMIKEGALNDVDFVIGAHLWQPMPVGTMGITHGRMLAAPDKFIIRIYGKGGHGSMPHQTIDSILIGAQIVVALNTIISRNVDPLDAAVLSIGILKSGEAFNIIPDTAVLRGTVRCFGQDIMENIFRRIESIIKGICDCYGATYQLERGGGPPALINNFDVAETVIAAGRETFGKENVREVQPVMISDDFSCYLQKIPGAYMFIGCGNISEGIVFPHHHPKFDLDETALKYGMEIIVRTAFKLLE